MRFGSVCSGIEAASCAWHPLGWETAFVSEIDAFPSAALAHHYPDVPNYGDMTQFKEWPDAAIDVLVGGTPCQSFSVAGLRGGLDDARGNLMLTYGAIARRYRPQWVVWENVPGVLSSDGGTDFGSFLGLMSGQLVECPASGWQNSGIIPGVEGAYGLAWRVLDAQYFGVPQRRRRVFVVGCLGDWRRAAAVLFERHSLQGHPAPRREKGKRTAAATARSVAIRGRDGTPQAELGDDKANAILTPNGGRCGVGVGAVLATAHRMVAFGEYVSDDTASAMKMRDYKDATDLVTQPVAIQGAAHRENPSSGPDGVGVRTDGVAYTLEARSEVQAVAFKASHFTRGKDGAPADIVPPLSADADKGDQDTLICFGAKDSGGDALVDCSPTLRAGGFTGSHANAGVMPAIAFNARQDPDAWTERTGPLDTDGSTQAIAFAQNQRDEVRTVAVAGALAAEPGMKQQTYIAIGGTNGELDDGALEGAEGLPNGSVREMRSGEGGGSSQGRRLAQQRADQSGEALSELPHQGASPASGLRDMRESREGAGLLQQALHPAEAVGRPNDREGQSKHSAMQVRRLTPRECERLQGFADDYTLIPYRNKPAADGPRYKALGNSMAVPVMRWIGERIAAVTTATSPSS